MKDSLVCSFIGLAKFTFAGLITLVFRLVTPLLGLPNVAPLMATELAGAKAYGPWIGGLYGALGMVALDAITGNLGPWTWYTSLSYGLIGIFGGLYMKNRPVKVTDFLAVSLAATLFFDIATGIVPTLIYGKTMFEALVLQAPFTARHIGGNLFFALFAPWFYRAIIGNPKYEILFIYKGVKI